ncbi:MAG: HAD family hydrolase [Gammaproteobacteria bacterium]|nr:HAD family hydrolase [Gammaproteobacteria bacterium]NNL99677.1 HAD family hydrolase [Gammaproteobacteria bacterium]
MPIEVVTLDLDDTLWYSEPALRRAEAAMQAWLEQHCASAMGRLTPDQLAQRRLELRERRPELAHDFTAMRRAFLEEMLAESGADTELAGHGIAEFIEVRSRVDLYPDVLPVLEQLARNYRLVAMTNGNADIGIAGVDGYFDLSVTPAEAGAAKPDTRMFEYVFDNANVDPDAVVHVGDQPYYDIEAAHRAAVVAVWMNRTGAQWPDEHRPPTAEISSLHELPALLRMLDARD